MKIRMIVVCCFSCLFTFAMAHALKGDKQTHETGYLAARLLEDSKRWGASYPGKALSKNRSGAVELIYIVNSEGKPSEIVVGSFTNRIFIRQAVKALKKYRYKPALRDGNPVPSLARTVFTFTGRLLNSKVVDQFDKDYELFRQELAKPAPSPKLLQNYLRKMKSDTQTNPSAQAVLNYAAMVYAEQYQPLRKKIDAAYTADIFRLGGLSIDQKFEIKQKLVSWLVAAGRYADASNTLKSPEFQSFAPVFDMELGISSDTSKSSAEYLLDYQESVPELSELFDLEKGPFAEAFRRIEEIKRSDKPFANLFEVSARGYVLRGLLRGRFTIDQIDGQIEELIFRCREKFYRIGFRENRDYLVPDAWGECHLQITGRAGTRARILEGSR